jgi:hypothetical protein
VTYGAASVSFTATASGTPAPTVQWQLSTNGGVSFNDITGAMSNTLTIPNPNVAMSGYKYQAVFTNSCAPGIATSTAATLTVNPKALDITANNQTKTYGATFTFTGSEFTTGAGQLVGSDSVTSVTLTSSGAAATTTVTAPGPDYAIVPSAAVGTGLGNYSINYINGNLHINPANASVTANGTSKTYGQTVTFNGTEFTTSGFVNGDGVTSVTLTSTGAAATATVTTPGPDYPIVPTNAVGTGLGNYNISYNNGTLHIAPKNASVTANSTSKTYGQTVTFAGTEFTTSGFINGDSVTSVTLNSAGAAATATVTAPGPDYPIVPSAAVGSGLGNYIISYNNGTLHINPANASVTADNRTKTYGQTVNFAGTEFTTSGFVNSDSVTSVTLTSAGAAATATVTAPGPDYDIVPSNAVGTGLGNYNISYVNGALHINTATLTITATTRRKVFGATYTPDTTPPSVDFTVGGLVNSDTVTSITLTCAGYAAAALPQPTPYPVVPSAAVGTGLGNYTINYVNGQFTIGYGTCTGSNPGGIILQPINADGSSVFKVGTRTIPVKFTVCDANGNPISDPMAVFGNSTGSITLLSAVRGTVNNVNDTGSNDIPDVAFRYSDGIWIFNMATNNLNANTTYQYSINLANGTPVLFQFGTK